jgi:ElaB/YqjD/DUF883 family membrane-anchored ribosome-binding protein
MIKSSELANELQALKGDVSRLLNTTTDGIREAANARAKTMADQIQVALSELGETLSEQDDKLDTLISDRPITTMASAFALGLVVGFLMRGH